MNPSEPSIDFTRILQIALLIAVPLTVLIIAVASIMKARSKDTEFKPDPLEMEILKESMSKIAQEKLAQRESDPVVEKKEKLDPDDVRKIMEGEREEFDEFELVEPIVDVEKSDPETEDKKDGPQNA